MANRLTGLGADNSSTHKFVAYDASGQVWNGSAYEAWADANVATYLLTANRLGTTTRYTGDEPAEAVRYELWYWTGTLSTSYVVWDDVIDPAVNVTQVNGSAATLGSPATAAELAAAVAGQGVPVNVNAPVAGGLVQIIRKDSYKNSEGTGRALNFTKQGSETAWPDTIDEAHFYCAPTDQTLDANASAVGLSDIEMTVVTATGDDQQVRLELTSAQTGTLQAGLRGVGGYTYWIVANKSTEPATLRSGAMTVRPDPTA